MRSDSRIEQMKKAAFEDHVFGGGVAQYFQDMFPPLFSVTILLGLGMSNPNYMVRFSIINSLVRVRTTSELVLKHFNEIQNKNALFLAD